MNTCYNNCMQTLCWLILLTGAYPLWQAWRANRRSSLVQSLYWAMLSWAMWGIAMATSVSWPVQATKSACYLALSLTGCASVAVLGARRPGVNAWNFVVFALLAVDLLPLVECLFTDGNLRLDVFRVLCLAATLAVGLLNYLPTRLAPAALLLILGCAIELMVLVFAADSETQLRQQLQLGWVPIALTPWAAYVCLLSSKAALAEFDSLWLDFRNRFGFVWAQRLRDQFNRSATNAGWPVVLRWQGLRLRPGTSLPEPSLQVEIVGTLRALMKRFGPEE